MSPTHLSVMVEPDERRWIRTTAARNGISVTALVRALVQRLRSDDELLAWCVEHAATGR